MTLMRLFSIFLFILLFGTALFADDETSTIHIPRISLPISIDGKVDDPGWKQATKIDNFYTYRPVDGIPAEEKTAVLIGYNQTSLYVAFICFDPYPKNVRASISRRDEIDEDDDITIFLDTFNSGKEAYIFTFNPYGIQADGLYSDMIGADYNPDFIHYSKGNLFSRGYIVEIEIPFKSLRFPDDRQMVWGITFTRTIRHLDKDLVWPKISLNATSFINQFGKLSGLQQISPGYHIEILPEAWAIQQGNLLPDPEKPGEQKFVEEKVKIDAGLNLKFGLFSDLTLDLTYNPDFSQVEADADRIDVNRRFPLFYPEKRPFFLEGTNIFQTPINAVYTRRIVDPLAGLKLTGSLGSLETGLLGGIDEYYGSEEYLSEQVENRFYKDPDITSDDSIRFMDKYKNSYSYHSILRLRHEIWDYSQIGLLFTDKTQKDAFSRTYGIDGNLLIANEWSVTFQALHSETRDLFGQYKNDPGIHVDLFRGSRTFNFAIYYKDIFPDFEVANGFLYRGTDFREGGGQFWYDIRSENLFIYLIRPSFFTNIMYTHRVDSIPAQKIEQFIAPSLRLEMRGQTALSFSYYNHFEEFFDSTFTKNMYQVEVENKTLSWLFVDGSVLYGDGIYYSYEPFLGTQRTLRWGLELRPLKNWSTHISGSHYLFKGNNRGTDVRLLQEIYRLRSMYQFTRELYLRLIVQQDNYYKSLDINVLAGWQPSPGTVVFLGYNDYFIRGESDKYQRGARGLFFKFSYLIRL